MRKIISVVALGSVVAASSVMASAYRIPEQSLDSTAKAGANIASADKADVVYYNPAGMALLEDAWHVEGAATYIHLTSIDFDGVVPGTSGSTEKENFLLPGLFVVSPDYNNFRFGFALTAPYGLAKRWKDDPYPKLFANKFELAVVEMNPNVSYKINDMISVGAGVRLLYSSATVMNNGEDLGYTGMTRWVDGDTWEWGYNLAIDVKPADNWNLALTYRSNVDLDFDGDVVISGISTTGEVSVPAPAVLSFSAAYTVDNWTFDLTIDRTFWSEYEYLDFDYAFPFPESLAAYYMPIPKDWDDSTAIRLGVEYQMNPMITLMGGIAYDENPVPDENIGFELPDSDAWLFSAGVRIKQSEKLEYGFAVLYDYKESRDVMTDTIYGEFSGASAILVTAGLSYTF